MARRLPGLAPVIGFIVAVPAGIYAAVFGPDVFTGALVTVGVFWPFAVFAVVYAESPSQLVPPRPALAAATAVGLALFALGTLASGEFLLGLFAGLLVVVPAVFYYIRHGEHSTALPPDVTMLAGGVVALAVLLAGIVFGRTIVLAVVDAVLVASLALAYRRGVLAAR